MPPPNGSVFTLAGTVQPAGTHFSIPARVCSPNTGMLPGAQVDIFSFDHDVGQFLSIGFATVSEDGATVCSNPGFGINKAGWFGATPPPPPTTEPKNCRVTNVTANRPAVLLPQLIGPPVSEEVVITATTDPANKTVTWSGDTGLNPAISGNTLRAKYTSSGDKIVTATCEQSSRSVTVKVIDVQFQTGTGAALSFPLRVGITAGGHDRTQHLRAVVTPAAEAANITLTASASLTLTNAARTNNVITFDLVGNTKSMARGDAMIIATHSSGSMTKYPVSVVIPSQVGTPHDLTGGGVVAANRVLDATTSPAAPGLPAGQVLLATIYVRFLNIIVWDQFGDTIGTLYQGALITEGGTSINQTLTMASTYADPTGIARFPAVNVVPAGSPAALAWPTQPLIPIPPGGVTVNTSSPVEVDGFALSPAVVNRSATANPPGSVTITWP
jgi:hypothetical protein